LGPSVFIFALFVALEKRIVNSPRIPCARTFACRLGLEAASQACRPILDFDGEFKVAQKTGACKAPEHPNADEEYPAICVQDLDPTRKRGRGKDEDVD
jgi:hypothetical protein